MLVFFTLVLSFVVVPTIVGTVALAIAGRRPQTRQPIGLLFHSVTNVPAWHCSYYSPFKFESFLSRLSGEGYSFATVSEATGHSLPRMNRCVVLTFDDGFANFFTTALPICERHGVKVTVFCVAGFLGKSSSWDALPKQSHLNAGQIRDIHSLGHEIGSHTLSHANLTLLSDQELFKELSESKKILEDITGKPVTCLSFPFGRVNPRVWKSAQAVGFTSATSYACRGNTAAGIIPLSGVYSYDSVQDAVDRTLRPPLFSHAVARGCLMPHFAKGSPLWKYRSTYSLTR